MQIGAVVCGLTAGSVGWLIFYGRMGPLQTTILTYTFTLILWTLAVSFQTKIGSAVVGGNNGLSNIPGFVIGFGQDALPLEPRGGMLITTIVVAAAVYLFVRALMCSPFDLVITCIRLNRVKTELLGYDIRRYQLRLFALAGGVAGIAGTLFGAWANYLNPLLFSVQETLLIPIYVLVNGLGTLAGSFIGALAVGGLSLWLGGGGIGGRQPSSWASA